MPRCSSPGQQEAAEGWKAELRGIKLCLRRQLAAGAGPPRGSEDACQALSCRRSSKSAQSPLSFSCFLSTTFSLEIPWSQVFARLLPIRVVFPHDHRAGPRRQRRACAACGAGARNCRSAGRGEKGWREEGACPRSLPGARRRRQAGGRRWS